MTTNLELDDIAEKINIPFYKNARMREELKGSPDETECGIINLDKLESKGSHWTCYYKKGNDCYFFDSYGSHPPTEVIDYLQPNRIIYHSFQIQDFNTEICGEICILVLYLLSQGCRYEDIVLEMIPDDC